MIIGFVCALVIIGLDQVTKHLVYGTISRSIIGNFLWFESTLNTGVAFSMFEGKSFLFFIVAIIASAVICYFICSKRWLKTKTERLALGFILGGTVSNAIDRLLFGGVRDFIYLKFINFAIFNIADIAITIGAILFCVGFIFLRDRKADDRT